jgi:hypothetical protein
VDNTSATDATRMEFVLRNRNRTITSTDHPRQFGNEPNSTIPRLPTDAVPVTVTDNRIPRIPDKHDFPDPNTNNQIPTTFEDYSDILDHWERNLLRTTGNTRDTNDVTNRIRERANKHTWCQMVEW